MSVAVTLNNTFYFVQQAAGLADIFNEISRFHELSGPASLAQKPNTPHCMRRLAIDRQVFLVAISMRQKRDTAHGGLLSNLRACGVNLPHASNLQKVKWQLKSAQFRVL
ncbi:hypothetical protein [Rhodoferax lacus]|uniref:hypothetical protein n=1 Tax=Rhodoferax lacus TaxID=2184758 RepID=UPI001F44142F|nr:hypothetical protein [Rhodoferax lacus]